MAPLAMAGVCLACNPYFGNGLGTGGGEGAMADADQETGLNEVPGVGETGWDGEEQDSGQGSVATTEPSSSAETADSTADSSADAETSSSTDADSSSSTDGESESTSGIDDATTTESGDATTTETSTGPDDTTTDIDSGANSDDETGQNETDELPELDINLQIIGDSDFLGGGGYLEKRNCPEGQVLIGFEGTYGYGRVQGFRGLCGYLEHRPGEANLQVVAGAELDFLGSRNGDDWQRACPENQMISGFHIVADGYAVDYLAFECAKVELKADETLVRTPGDKLKAVGTSSWSPRSASCSPRSQGIARGLQVNQSGNLRAVGLRCAQPMISASY